MGLRPLVAGLYDKPTTSSGPGPSTITKIFYGTASFVTTGVPTANYVNFSVPCLGALSGDLPLATFRDDLTSGLVIANLRVTTDAVIVRVYNTDLVADHDLIGAFIDAAAFRIQTL